jgi:hypothetical protein
MGEKASFNAHLEALPCDEKLIDLSLLFSKPSSYHSVSASRKSGTVYRVYML